MSQVPAGVEIEYVTEAPAIDPTSAADAGYEDLLRVFVKFTTQPIQPVRLKPFEMPECMLFRGFSFRICIPET